MDVKKVLSILSGITTIIGFGVNLAQGMIADKQLDMTIDEKMEQKLAEQVIKEQGLD